MKSSRSLSVSGPLALGVALLLGAAGGCESDSDPPGAAAPDTAGQDGGADVGPDTGQAPPSNGKIDSLTSATPGVPSAVLDDSHTGWRQAGCFTAECHAPEHGGRTEASCTVCHGTNGADPLEIREAHEDDAAACGSCHMGSHAGLTFADPLDCTTCHKFAPGVTCPATRAYDVAVIGAGGGGLAAAAGLARAGKKVVVIEKHNKVGGYMTAFERAGYRFEVSLHGFDGMDPDGLNQAMFADLGILKKVQPVKSATMYRAIYPDFTFDVPNEIEAYRTRLVETFPDEAAGIDAVFAEAELLDSFLSAYTAFQKGAGEMPPIEDLQAFQALGEEPLQAFLEERLSDPRLIQLYTQLAGFAGNEPQKLSAGYFLAMWNSYHRYGYYFFEGGSQSLTNALAEVVVENGGTLRLGTLATKIGIEAGVATHVETLDDACYTAEYVVSNANAPATIHDLIGTEHVDPADVAKYDSWQVGLSAYVVYLGVDHDYRDAFGDTHEWMITDSYDPHTNFETIYTCDPETAPFAIANYTVVDPTDAPAGKNVIEVTGQFAWECGDAWHEDGSVADYKAYKDAIADVLVRRAEEYLPGLREHIEVVEVGTPRTMAGFTLNPKGTIFGWDTVAEQSMMNRMDANHLKGIDNLWMAGAWGFPGGGQSAVLMGGAMAVGEILAAEAAATEP